VGFGLFLALGLGAYVTARSVIRRASEDPELSWTADLAAMVQVSIGAYAIAGLFLNLATFDLYYHLLAIVVIASALVRKAAPSEMSTGAIDRAAPFDRPSDARA
jgi:ABC-type branched-subunit amino acid transport system permease subunit